MKEEANYFQETRQKLNEYIQRRILLLKLQAADKVSHAASTIITATIITILVLFVLIFASIAAAYWLATLTGSLAAGFGIVALFYLFVFLFVILFLRKIIRNSFVDKFVKLIYKKD
ncbi:phage holin family protein [Parafilimonas terrae]|uniref:Putative Holin-X, holin superfamily III n=1 Tax=Parafilimonas terrae TaxID=1465490 RepID=A0A1I5RK54_9BACT|nr:phage holin family protein [Parafilimonas terrae]SFP58918.1 Putative Holin-X, holin superfamily III [Parafilimonas terrae]